MTENIAIKEMMRAVSAGEVEVESVAGGWDIREVEWPHNQGDVFVVENPDYPYVYLYQIVRRVPGVSRCVWQRNAGGVWEKSMPPRFLCRLVEMRRTDG